MLSSMIHHPCELNVHLISEDIFIHPPPPSSEFPGDDQTLRGVLEIKAPSERLIEGIKITLQALQTLSIPESSPGGSATAGLRWEEKCVMDKSMEIWSDGEGGIIKHHKVKGKSKAKEKAHHPHRSHGNAATASVVNGLTMGTQQMSLESNGEAAQTSSEDGIWLSKGVHGFEFSFIIPASAPPFERSRHGRVKYVLTATALGAGRAKHNVSTTREIFVILNVNKDGGPTPLEITYADVHEALGPFSVSLTAASLTVGGTATLTVVHPDPPPKLTVHVIRVFCEQTFEMFSTQKQAWLKLPSEKLRIAEWGHMPNKSSRPPPLSEQVTTTLADSLWLSDPDGGEGHPGKGATHLLPHVAPYGSAIPHPSHSAPQTPRYGPTSSPLAFTSNRPLHEAGSSSHTAASTPHLGTDGLHQQNGRKGYKIKATVRLPNDDHLRPSTVRGSKAEIRVGHEMGVEVFFSRLDVLDEKEGSETKGKPKVQVFSARRAVVIPSCTATFDTVHLPPYVQESPVNSRPPSPGNLARSPQNHFGGFGEGSSANHSHADLQKLANTLHNTLPGGRGRASPSTSKIVSRGGSRDPSPTRPGLERGSSTHSIGHSISAAFGSHFPSGMGGRKSRPNSRPASPTHERPDPINGSSGASSPIAVASAVPHSRTRRTFGLHALTPATPATTATTSVPNSTPPTPLHHPAHPPHSGSYLGHSHSGPSSLSSSRQNSYSQASSVAMPPPHTPRTGQSHDTCNCGRSTEELYQAEHRLLDGVPTAPGAFTDAHAEGEEPPPWSQSRPASPDYFSQWETTTTAVATPAGWGSKTPYGSPP